ncbi:hypothetical protein [Falsiroseomonas oryzae]|uniref:hypothetical protein n=1 Tax=Falsiroseomonas oryzae TaxID=2766473 RepID=UPI0022EB0FCE|nr:hypothetical protein [Roseomonas sp. MO-31]
MDALAVAPPTLPRTPDGAVPHGPFLITAEGELHPQRVPALRFAWRGRNCEARLADGTVRLSAGGGAVPYTAERQQDRAAALAEVGRLRADLASGWRLRVMPDLRLWLEADAPCPDPVTATGLVAAMVGFVLALDPYLDRLEAAGVPASPVGMAKT